MNILLDNIRVFSPSIYVGFDLLHAISYGDIYASVTVFTGFSDPFIIFVSGGFEDGEILFEILEIFTCTSRFD
jgi:hypothetical protein